MLVESSFRCGIVAEKILGQIPTPVDQENARQVSGWNTVCGRSVRRPQNPAQQSCRLGISRPVNGAPALKAHVCSLTKAVSKHPPPQR